MYNTALRITNHRDDAEDVLQEAFISAFRQLASYQGRATFGAWLKRIVINRSIDCVKRRHLDHLPLSAVGDDHSEAPPEIGTTGHWEVAQVRKAMEKLPDGYRIVFSLYLLEGYDHEEIAEILGVSVSTSKSQLNRSKRKIRELLNQSYCHGE